MMRIVSMESAPGIKELQQGLIRCYWCGEMGCLSVYPFLINGSRLESRICTQCANAWIPDSVKGKYGSPVPVEETGIERVEREQPYYRRNII